MNYSIIYSSKTGNTAALAKTIQDHLTQTAPNFICLACTPVQDAAPANDDLTFIGFWTDKGSCDTGMQTYLQSLRGKRIFLFGTAGFGGSPDYFETILDHVKSHIDTSNTICGTFMCQGKMPVSVKQRYEQMLAADPDNVQMQQMLKNFEQAASHPDVSDLDALKAAMDHCL